MSKLYSLIDDDKNPNTFSLLQLTVVCAISEQDTIYRMNIYFSDNRYWSYTYSKDKFTLAGVESIRNNLLAAWEKALE